MRAKFPALVILGALLVACSDSSDPFAPESAPTPSVPAAAVTSPAPASYIARLSSEARVLMGSNTRLDRINAEMGNPPDDQKPPIRAALTNVITQANAILAVAAEIETKLDCGGLPCIDGP